MTLLSITFCVSLYVTCIYTSSSLTDTVYNYDYTITVAEDVLTADNADTATETFVSVLDVIFTNDSYETTVLEGGTSETFEENLVTVTNSVGEIENAVASNDNIGEDDKAKAQACLDKVKELLELLAGVVEGPQV